jgi:predicted transcriptional regulator
VTGGRTRRVRVLTLDGGTDGVELERALRALGSVNRMRILRHLTGRMASVNDMAAALGIPTSTVALHVESLEEAGLIKTEFEPASRGLRKICARMYDEIVIELPTPEESPQQVVELSMPIGAFVDCRATPTCGLASERGIIGLLDDPASFYEAQHVDAQLLWFRKGYVEYRFPNRPPGGARPEWLRLSMEMCSEAPHHNLNWPSDISVWINGVEIGTWTSPADFGGERGRLTPDWWPTRDTQYGLMKVWHVSERNSEIDGMPASDTTIHDLRLDEAPFITVRVGVREDAEHVGGLNLFGTKFGNYPQDLILRIGYHTLQPRHPTETD